MHRLDLSQHLFLFEPGTDSTGRPQFQNFPGNSVQIARFGAQGEHESAVCHPVVLKPTAAFENNAFSFLAKYFPSIQPVEPNSGALRAAESAKLLGFVSLLQVATGTIRADASPHFSWAG